MKSLSKALLCLCLLAAASSAVAQSGASKSAKTPGTIQMSQIAQISDFDESTWAQLLKSSPRPAAYLFTTSYCSSCPDAFEQLHKAVLHKAPAMPLTVVMMDVSGAQALRHALHFQGLTQMYAFDGYAPAIRYSVDPAWPDVTPYIVLIDKQGHLQRSIGAPSAKALRAWLG